MERRADRGCGVAPEQLASSIWGDELGQHTLRYLGHHVPGCPDCTRETVELQGVVHSLRAWPDEEPPFNLVFTEAEVGSGPGAGAPSGRRSRRWQAGAGRWLAAAAAVGAAAALGVILGGRLQGPSPAAREPPAVAMAGAELVTAHQLEVSERRTTAQMVDMVERIERMQTERMETLLEALAHLAARHAPEPVASAPDPTAGAGPSLSPGSRASASEPAPAARDGSAEEGNGQRLSIREARPAGLPVPLPTVPPGVAPGP